MSVDIGLNTQKGSALYHVKETVSLEDDYSPEEEKQLLKKVDLSLMPTIWLMYLLSYIDRSK